MENQKSSKRLTLDVFKEKAISNSEHLDQNGGVALTTTSSLCPSIVTIVISGVSPSSCSSNDCHA